MKTTFIAPYTNKDVTPRIERDIIGPGNPGAKSSALLSHRPLFETSSDAFQCLPQVAITPGFFADFLKRAGASHEDPEGAATAIRSADFSGDELDGIRAAVAPFRGLYTAIRSDECTSGGNGLWHSGFVLSHGSKHTLRMVADIVKSILASDFSRDVIAFKKRAGLPITDTPGVLVMPVDAMPIVPQNTYTTPFHVNAITDFACGDTLIQIGIGVGGANIHYARVVLLRELDEIHFRLLSRLARTAQVFGGGKIKNLEDDEGRADAQTLLDIFVGCAYLHIHKLREGFLGLKGQKHPPLYLELGYSEGKWQVVQCSDVEPCHVERPEERGRKVLEVARPGRGPIPSFGLNVSGRRIIESDTVVFIRGGNEPKILVEINKTTENYVLVLDIPPKTFSTFFSFADYSNAAAIIANGEMENPTMTHFSGALREAGIVVLAGDMDAGFLAKLRAWEPNKRHVLVYANDEREEGFVLDRG